MNHARTIVLTGGGTGGHITPVLAVASAIKKLEPDTTIIYIGEKGGALSDIPAEHPAIDMVHAVRAGKFRRFYKDGHRQMFDVPMVLHNLRDGIWVIAGIWQSFWLLGRLKPAIIFTRGGYVSVPVAFGGRLRGIPFVTHDSDSTPSLANRLIGRWAKIHAVGLDPKLYPYQATSTVMVGVPMSREYRHIDTKLQQSYRRALGLEKYAQLLLVTGGGNGADSLNKLVAQNARTLLERNPDLVIVQTAGRALEASLNELYDSLLGGNLRQRVIVKGFVSDLYRYSGAADVVIARAGASTLAELAVQGKPVIVIPASQLIWQEHQAQTLAEEGAIINLAQADAARANRLVSTVQELLDHPEKRQALSLAITKQAIPDAAERIARLLLDQSKE